MRPRLAEERVQTKIRQDSFLKAFRHAPCSNQNRLNAQLLRLGGCDWNDMAAVTY